MFAVHPEPLQFLALDVWINHLPSLSRWIPNNRGYLGGPDISKDILRITALSGIEKRRRNDGDARFDRDHADLIMDIITFSILPATELIFPPSFYVPTLRQLRTHLSHHGHKLTALSLYRCDAPSHQLLRVIGEHCSSNLKSLVLPAFLDIDDECVDYISGINCKFSATLRKLDLASSVFSTVDTLLRLLSQLPRLEDLNLSNVSFSLDSISSNDQMLPLPLDGSSLPRLESLNLCSIRYLNYYHYWTTVDAQRLEIEWTRFFEQCPRLKILQVAHTFATVDAESLLVLKKCLDRRREPLEYLRIRAYSRDYSHRLISFDRSEAISIIREMNADEISAGETFPELFGELNRNDVDFFFLNYRRIHKLHDLEVTQMLGKPLIHCPLAAVRKLIPTYRHVREVFHACVNAILVLTQQSDSRLSPTAIEGFLTLVMGPENSHFSHVKVYDILALYRANISVKVFEKVLRTLIALTADDSYTSRKICSYISGLPDYCTVEYIVVIERILGNNFCRMRATLPRCISNEVIQNFLTNLQGQQK